MGTSSVNNQAKSGKRLGKLYILSVVLLIACASMFAVPVFAADTWSQYGRPAPINSSNPGGFNSPTGVAVDSSGNMYVADVFNNRIQKLTVSTNTWSEWKKVGGGAGSDLGEFSMPFGVAVDGSGNVYVADYGNNRIQKLTISTNTWSEWKKVDGDAGSGLGEFNQPSGVAVDSSGNVYVADSGNHRIQKLTASTNTWNEWGKADGYAGNGLGEFASPSGVAVDSSGNVYVADYGNHRIQKLTISTNTWSEWGKADGYAGSDLGEFTKPFGVAVDSSGNVYVTDSGNHRIQKLTISTSAWSEWKTSDGGPGSGLGEFHTPAGVAVDRSGNLYVADYGNHRIQKLTAAENIWSQWCATTIVSGSLLGEFNVPSGVAVDSSGNMYVVDAINNRIQKLSGSTNTWSEWKKIGGGAGSDLGEFSMPFGVAVDSSGNVYVADYGNNRIQKLTISTNTWSEWKKVDGGEGSGLGEFNQPSGVAVDSSGNVYVADSGNHRIQKLTASTNTWSEWGKVDGYAGNGLGEFASPSGVAIDSSGNVYVADYGNHRIQKLTVSTNTWSEWGKVDGGAGSDLGEFTKPFGVAVDSSGNVYVTDSGNHRVQKLTRSTSAWSEWKKSDGGPGNGLGEFNTPAGVAVDSGGNVYVADSFNFRIQKLRIPASPITDFASIAKTSTTASFSWTEASGATGIMIEQSPAGANTWTTATTGTIAVNATSATVTGLSAATAYDFRLVVTGGANAGSSNTVDITTDAAAPGAPTGVTAVAGNGEATVSFTPPTSDGGSPITSYTVTASPGGQTATGAASPIIVAGLINGTSYTFTVKAVNVVGSGVTSVESNVVIPSTLTYTIAPIVDQTLAGLTAQYRSGSQERKTITVTRTGTGDLNNLAASLGGLNAADFEITRPTATTLNTGTTSTTFTVKVKDGLAAGTYTATVTVSADNMTNVTFTVKQVVSAAPNSPVYYPVSGVTLDQTSLKLIAEGNSETLHATVYPSYATNAMVIWSSSNPAVAQVNEYGVVTPHSEGEAIITVITRDGGKTATTKVMVEAKKEEVKLLGVEATTQGLLLKPNKSVDFEVFALYSDGKREEITLDKMTQYESSSTSKVSVKPGKIKAGKKEGEATITISYLDQRIEIAVMVSKAEVKELSFPLEEDRISLMSGESKRLRVRASLSNGKSIEATKIVEWSSDDSEVVSVKDGKLTAIAPGTTTIRAAYGDKTAILTVEVTKDKQIKRISVNKRTLKLTAGQSESLKLTAYYQDGTTKNVTDKAVWTSSDEQIVTVSDGVITAVSPGTAKILATYKGKTVSINITVIK
ncbi:Ig-like domain-containing protein [Brevibacillus fluminis]|uniref:Ig-like domain-containing protein n=1 Tax=Brevibacillus fluminis TaxID=511487 RepID=UPI003F8AA120